MRRFSRAPSAQAARFLLRQSLAIASSFSSTPAMFAQRHCATSSSSASGLAAREGGNEQPPGGISLHEAKIDGEARVEDEGFDEMEAVSQELFDVSSAMIEYARMATTRWDHPMYFKRRRESVKFVPIRQRVVRQQGGTGGHLGYPNRTNLDAATKLYFELGAKAVQLLTPEAMDRLVSSAGKHSRDHQGSSRTRHRDVLRTTSWSKFPVKRYSKAPYELQQLRADIPEALVLNARSLRDMQTLRNLMTLIAGTEHPFREQLEGIVWKHVEKWDVAFREKMTPSQ
jgi:hypothetical protein